MARATLLLGSLLAVAHAGETVNGTKRATSLRGFHVEEHPSVQAGMAKAGSDTPWGEVSPNMNCYDGHGGTPLSDNQFLKYEDCFQKCDWTDGCSCITTGLGLDNQDCYLLSACELSSCETSTDWMVTVLPNDRPAEGGACPHSFPFIETDNSAPFDPPFPWAFDSADFGEQFPEPPFSNDPAFPCGIDLEPSMSFDYLNRIKEDPASLHEYLKLVYGEKAVQSAPPVTDDLTFFWNNAPRRDELDVPRVPFFACQMQFGQPFAILDGSTWEDSAGEKHSYPGFFMVPRDNSYKLLPDMNEWVEVMHTGRIEDHTEAKDISSAGQFWYWVAPGSGIWVNVGNMYRCYSAGQNSCGGCPWAVANGYDTIMNTPPLEEGKMNYGGMVELMDCRGAQGGNEALLEKMWQGSCPPPGAGQLRSGLPWKDVDGSDQWSCECQCDKSKWYLNCER